MLNPPTHHVGIIASTALLQHHLAKVVSSAGYQVAVNTFPEKFDIQLVSKKSIQVLVVQLNENNHYDEFLPDLMDVIDIPVLFDEGEVPISSDEEYSRWSNRILAKLALFATPVIDNKLLPKVQLESLIYQKRSVALHLPIALQKKTKEKTTPLWVLCASLGGPQAVKEFVDLLPYDTPAAFLYAQHIDAECIPPLVQSIGRHTQLEFVFGEPEIELTHGKVIVVPVDHEITFTEDHKIHYETTPWDGPYGPSHDHLLKNVAEHFSNCNAIILAAWEMTVL